MCPLVDVLSFLLCMVVLEHGSVIMSEIVRVEGLEEVG